MRIAVFASGAGSTLEMLLQLQAQKKLNHEIVLLVTNVATARARLVADKFKIKNVYLATQDFSNFLDWDSAVAQVLSENKIDFILLAGFLKKIGPKVLEKFKDRIVNTHPSLLPKYGGVGMYGRRVHEAVIAAKEQETGATLHIVNENVDEGRILRQVKINVNPSDTAETLEQNIKSIEKKMIVEFINQDLS